MPGRDVLQAATLKVVDALMTNGGVGGYFVDAIDNGFVSHRHGVVLFDDVVVILVTFNAFQLVATDYRDNQRIAFARSMQVGHSSSFSPSVVTQFRVSMKKG